jgi:hypothetical protein
MTETTLKACEFVNTWYPTFECWITTIALDAMNSLITVTYNHHSDTLDDLKNTIVKSLLGRIAGTAGTPEKLIYKAVPKVDTELEDPTAI